MNYIHKQGMRFSKVCEDDLEILLKWKSESWWGTHTSILINMEDQKKWYQSLNHANWAVMVYDKNGTRVGAGIFNIDWISRSANISGMVGKKYRTKSNVEAIFGGGVDFAFEILNVQRLTAEVAGYHFGAAKVEIDYLGFKVEGIKRRAIYKSGNYYDSIYLGLLREEWDKTQRVIDLQGCCNRNCDRVTKENELLVKEHFLKGFSASIDSV